MRFSLKNIAIIILVNILLYILVLIRFSFAANLYSPAITMKIDFNDFESTSNNPSPSISKCITHPTYYTDEEISNIFQFKDYKQCQPVGHDQISYKEGVFEIKCSNNQKSQFGVDINKVEYYGGSIRNFPKWLYSLPLIKEKQFLFIRCSRSAPYAFVFNHFKQKVANKAKKIQKEMGDNKEQMSVLLLVLDSISKYSFERDLPYTMNFLQELGNSEEFGDYFSVYQFNKSAIPQAFTRPNMAQILYGKSWEEIAEVVGENIKLIEYYKEKYNNYQVNSIWRHFSSLGYVTMFSHAGVFDYISAFTGRHILVDHSLSNFWRYLWGVTNTNPFLDGQKCIGGRNFHDLLFDYTYQFFDNYPNNNKFAYIHSDAAHETTGNVRTIDEDLLGFLRRYLRLIKERNENLAIFLMSDHGNKKIKSISQWDTRAFFEYNTPFTYLITTKNITRDLNIDENLKHYEDQLISRYDINLSLKHLAYFPYNVSIDSWYSQAKDYYTYKKTVSLFKEKVSNERTCADFGINKEHCLCSWYEPVEYDDNEVIIKKEMINLISKYFNETEENYKNCSVLNKIEKVNTRSFILKKAVGKLVKLYKLELITKKRTRIIANFNFCLKNDLKVTDDSFEFYDKPHTNLRLNDETYFLQISNLSYPFNCFDDFCDC